MALSVCECLFFFFIIFKCMYEMALTKQWTQWLLRNRFPRVTFFSYTLPNNTFVFFSRT